MKKTMLAAALVAASSTAMADVQLSGQVNSAAILDADQNVTLDDMNMQTGFGSFDTTIVDNNTSGSRFRFKASKKIGNGLKAGMRYEFQDQDNVSSNLSDRADTDVRYSDVFIQGSFGKVGIGKGDGAANGSFESYGLLNFLGGSESHLLWQGATDLAYRDIDGISRQNRIRYDSPKFGGGFKVALSLDNADTNEFAIHYNGKVAGGKLRFRYGAVDRDSGSDVTSYSVAYKFGFGLGLAFSDGESDPETGTDTEADWFQVSYDIGKTTISYGTGESGAGVDNEFSTFSVNYKPAKGVELYLNLLDFENAAVQDALANDVVIDGDGIAIGSRFKF